MTTTQNEHYAGSLSAAAAAEIRAIMARKQISGRKLAKDLGVNAMWVNRRINSRGYRTTALDLNDIERIAGALGVAPTNLLPRLDSNQQPFGYPSRELAAAA